MNKRERVIAAMHGEEVDRVPVTFYGHCPNLYDNTVAYQTEYCKNADMDLYCIGIDGYMHFHWAGPLLTAEDWGKIRPHKKDDYYIAGQVDRAARMVEALPDVPMFYMFYSPFSTIRHTMPGKVGGHWYFHKLYRDNPECIKHAMNVIMEDHELLMDELKAKTGIDGLFLSLQNGERWRFSVEEYMEILNPWDKRYIKAANDRYENNIIHMCSWANEPNHMEVWRDLDYKTVNWGVYPEAMSLGQGRNYFKPGTNVMGGFDRNPEGILYCGDRESIKDETKRIIREAGDKGLILSADCSIEESTPAEHMRWVVEAAEEYAAEK